MAGEQNTAICNSSFDGIGELSKYILQCFPLLVSLVIHFRFIVAIREMYRKNHWLNSFYSLYLLECILNCLSILSLICITQPIAYIIYLCPILVETFPSPSYLLNFLWISEYLQTTKFLTHAFMSINRMTCVLFPLEFSAWWQKWLFSCVLFVLLAPFLAFWTALLSKTSFVPYMGGVRLNYDHIFLWARLSIFKALLLTVILVTVLVCSSVTIWCLLTKKKKVQKADKNLCVTTVISALEVVGLLSVQVFFALAPFTDTSYDSLMQTQTFIYDLVLLM